MSNHWHGVVTDPDARLPEFLETFHKLVAKVQNASTGRWENFWSSDKTSVVLLVSEDDVLDKMAYTLANPTSAGLVKSPEEWPGVLSKRFGERRTVEMPDIFFDENGSLPDSAVLEFSRPPIFAELSDDQLQLKLDETVAELVRQARADRRRRGLAFLGRNAALRQAITASPVVTAARRNPNPRVAAGPTPLRICAIKKMLMFLRQYRAAWSEWRKGKRDTLFPHGTYALRVFAGVPCEHPAPS